jgi:hypothetical protein
LSPRTDTASRIVDAAPAAAYRALLDPEGLRLGVCAHGHATVMITLQTYQHVLQGMQAEAPGSREGMYDRSVGRL